MFWIFFFCLVIKREWMRDSTCCSCKQQCIVGKQGGAACWSTPVRVEYGGSMCWLDAMHGSLTYGYSAAFCSLHDWVMANASYSDVFFMAEGRKARRKICFCDTYTVNHVTVCLYKLWGMLKSAVELECKNQTGLENGRVCVYTVAFFGCHSGVPFTKKRQRWKSDASDIIICLNQVWLLQCLSRDLCYATGEAQQRFSISH